MSIKWCYWADLHRNLANEEINITALWKEITVSDAVYGISWHGLPWISNAGSIMKEIIPDLEDDDLQCFPNKEISKSRILYMLREVFKISMKKCWGMATV